MNASLAPSSPASAMKFDQFDLPTGLKKSLARMSFVEPTPVQAQTLPVALEGRDILGCAQTGTGKTGAFAIPMVARLSTRSEHTALIMTPTRELALQVFEFVKQLSGHDRSWGVTLLIGGTAYGPQFRALRQNPRIVIGTPGRIQDHLDQGSLRLGRAGFLVLDEADRMLDMGFAPQIEAIVASMPEERQTMLFTATLPQQIERIAARFLKNPSRIMVGPNSRPVEKVKQEVIQTRENEKREVLFRQIDARKGSVLIFAKTKRRTEMLTEELSLSGYDVVAIHGDRTQRQRDDALKAFRKGGARILVATDVAARGLDVPHIAHVINFDLPQVPEDYIHRIGRTARAGAEGEALTLVTPSERGLWRRIERLIGGDSSASGGGFGNRPAGRFGGRKPFGRPRFDRENGEERRRGDGPRPPRFDRGGAEDNRRGFEGRRPRFERGNTEDNRGGQDRGPRRFDRDERKPAFAKRGKEAGPRPRPKGKFSGLAADFE